MRYQRFIYMEMLYEMENWYNKVGSNIMYGIARINRML